MDDDEGQPPWKRCRMTEYRREGSRRARYAVQQDLEDVGNNQDGQGQAPNVEDDVEDAQQDHEQENFLGNPEIPAEDDPPAFDDNADGSDQGSDDESAASSDSNWSDIVNNDAPDSENEVDYDVFEEEREFIPDPHDSEDGSEDSEDDGDNINLDHASLNQDLILRRPRTARESLYLDLALSVRHKMTFENLMDLLRSKNTLLGDKYFPTNKRELWKVLGRTSAGVKAHVYCAECMTYIGLRADLPEMAVCPSNVCGVSKLTSKASYFISISVRKQLEHFLATPGIPELLKYRENRTKLNENCMEDIFDSRKYKAIRVDGRPLLNSNNYSYTFNSDGCKLRKGAKITVNPLYVRMNELPPQYRQKHLFLAGIFVDVNEPSMVSFLHPFVCQMNRLAKHGIKWTHRGEQLTSKFVPTCFCVDGKASSQMLNMGTHAGYYGCAKCTYKGILVNNTMRYPFQHQDLPPSEDRTDLMMKRDMLQAHQNSVAGRPNPVRGHKGITPLSNLKHLDLAEGNAFDDLHFIYECATVQHTEILIKNRRLDPEMGEDRFLETIDSRLRLITTPSCVARKPGSCKMKNRKQLHGNELRNWTIFYGIPCLSGLVSTADLQHLERLSYATYLMDLDQVDEAQIDEAERLLNDYVRLYDDFGIEMTRRNLHGLLHCAKSVRNWGPLWCYSTFNFESWNHKLLQLITSPKGAMEQMLTRHLIRLILELLSSADDRVDDDIKEQIHKVLMTKKTHVNATKVGEFSYFLGAAVERRPTNEEAAMLRLEGHTPDTLKTYQKLIMKGVSFTRRKDFKEDQKSDDTSIFTHQNTFCTIQEFVQFNDEAGNEVFGLIVLEHDVVQMARPRFQFAKHITPVQDGGLLHFIPVSDVKSPVVKVPLHGEMFFIPLPNLYEID